MKSIVKGSTVDQDGRIHIGDRILTVSDVLHDRKGGDDNIANVLQTVLEFYFKCLRFFILDSC